MSINRVNRGLAGPRGRHVEIVPNDNLDIEPQLAALVCVVSGTVAVMDEANTVLSYPMVAGDRLDFGPKRVMATGTTGTYYGWW